MFWFGLASFLPPCLAAVAFSRRLQLGNVEVSQRCNMLDMLVQLGHQDFAFLLRHVLRGQILTSHQRQIRPRYELSEDILALVYVIYLFDFPACDCASSERNVTFKLLITDICDR